MTEKPTTRESHWGQPRTRAGLLVFTAALALLLALSASPALERTTAPSVVLLAGMLLLAFVPRAIRPVEGRDGAWLRQRLVPRSAARAFYLPLGVGIVGAVLALQTGGWAASVITAGIVVVLGVSLTLAARSESSASRSGG